MQGLSELLYFSHRRVPITKPHGLIPLKNLAYFIFCLLPTISFAQFNWQHTSGPFGSVLSFIYANDKYAFAPADDFLFRSADGITWEKLEHPVSIEMSTYGDTIVNLLKNTAQDTIFLQLSYDNGESWIVKTLPESFLHSRDIRMCSHGIYITSNSNKTLVRSTDYGDSWTTVYTPVDPSWIWSFDERIYLYSSSQLWRTNQEGQAWENITPLNLPTEYVNDLVAIDSNIIFSTSRWLFASHNNGKTWGKTRKGETNNLFTLALVGEDVYAVANADLLRTTDLGTTWDTITTSDRVFDLVSFAGVNNTFLGASFNKGVFRWDEVAQTLTESNDGLSKGYVYDLAACDDKIWAACGNGVFVYDIPSETWSEKMNLPLPKFEYDYIYTNDQGWVMVTEEYGSDHFYLSENEGATWDTLSFSFNGYFRIDKIQMIDTVLVVFSDHQMFRSLDKGLHWEYIDIFVVDENIVAINGIQYLAGPYGFYIAYDNWNSWITDFPPIHINNLHAFENRLYAIGYDNSGNKGVFTSTDGFEWTFEGNGFPVYGSVLTQQAFFFRDTDAQYALLNEKGHYIMQDGTFSWSAFPTSQTGNSYVIHNNVIYLGGHGVYKSIIENPFITAIKEVGQKAVAGHFIISPNPANNFVNVNSKNLEMKDDMVMSLYDSKGAFIKSHSIVNPNNIQIDLQELPSGLYYLQMKMGKEIENLKFVKN